jgi:hypothetical protein
MKLCRRSYGIWALVLLAVTLPVTAGAQSLRDRPPQKAQKENSPSRSQVPQPTVNEGPLAAVELEPSQQQWVIGTRMGLLGKITNIADVPLRFYERETVFIAPAETRIYGTGDSRTGCVFFATEGNPASGPSKADAARGESIVLRPRESYWVFWDFDTNGCAGYPYHASENQNKAFTWWERLSQKIMFQPGPYKFILQAKFYELPEANPAGDGTPHFVSQQKDVRISASEGMILFAAAIGGLLAFLVKLMMPKTADGAAANPHPSAPGGVPTVEAEPPKAPRSLLLRRSFHGALRVAGAILLSVTVVIISSRLSESQFPLQVSVSDFWGALTIGFVGNFVGVYLIQKLIDIAPQRPTAKV